MPSAKPYYDAEQELEFMLNNGGTVQLHGSKLVMPEHRKFGDLLGAQRYVNRVCNMMGIEVAPQVRARKGDRKAHYSYEHVAIFLPDHKGSQHSWAMTELTVLHELAHHVRGPGADSHGHDAVWCGIFVELVARCIGDEAGFVLMCALSERGVGVKKWTPPSS